MGPYRNNRASARSTRTQIDHDVFEGLPVRHWRRAPVVTNTAPQKENLTANNTRNPGWPELPMPRDAHLLSPMSQALLRAARMGQVNKPPPPPLEDEKEGGEDDDGEGDIDTGFLAKRWTLVPKHLEGPEPEFLAKRRKGLPSVYGGLAGPLATTGQMRKTKVRKVDVEGNTYVVEVYTPEGQPVDGEVTEEAAVAEAPALGAVVDGVGVVNAEGVVDSAEVVLPTPPRRRPPPPKRKKGPGRGRRKRVAFAAGEDGKPALASGVNGTSNGATADIAKVKTECGVQGETSNGDAEMGDDSLLQDGEEGSDDDDDEGDEGVEGEREEAELSPSPDADAPRSLSQLPPKPPPLPLIIEPGDDPSIPEPEPNSVSAVVARDPSSSPEMPLAASHALPKLLLLPEPSLDRVPTPAPELELTAPVDHITVESPPPPIPLTGEVELPPQHNPLDGLAEPQATTEKPLFPEDGFEDGKDLLGNAERYGLTGYGGPPEEMPGNQEATLSDGELDLFGSLERHLDGKGTT
ncbi:MAG: hypothetical protein FRX48_07942 [Lasallia pustulata]|uniref:Uncharacterized protein n=1 Tax=Lasallia pustulata TaxID=136370 RepID=A0A5M8PH13_9LECA|nr:MAG: hypothetical protein FRX48_07942 [Lasallia pustulata]